MITSLTSVYVRVDAAAPSPSTSSSTPPPIGLAALLMPAQDGLRLETTSQQKVFAKRDLTILRLLSAVLSDIDNWRRGRPLSFIHKFRGTSATAPGVTLSPASMQSCTSLCTGIQTLFSDSNTHSTLNKLQSLDCNLFNGGEGGIRTLGARKGTLVFKTSAFNRSATSPCGGERITYCVH